MATQSWKAGDIQGLTPAIDERKSNQLYAMSGKNFFFDSKGPKSGFGNRLLTPGQIAEPTYIQGNRLQLKTGDRSFTFTTSAILEWDETTASFVTIFDTVDSSAQPHRWTAAYVNEEIFFCHPAVGIVVFDVLTSTAELMDEPGMPAQPIAVCADNGRLIIMDKDFYYWSAQSNGRDLVPSLGGAGFQKISDRVSGNPISIHSYSKGVLTFTTGGIMRSEFTGDSAVYRHRAINTEYRPINSFCTVQMDDNTILILDERGILKSQGESPQPLTPVFNEYLIQFLQDNNINAVDSVRLEWDTLRRLLFLSISTSVVNPIYEFAFVLYPPLDKWGSFDEQHYGILPFKIKTSQRADDYFGFVGSDSRARLWQNVGSRENVDGLVGLDAKVQIGLIRFEGLNDANDQMAEVNQLMIGSAISGDPNVLAEDYNLVPDGFDEDYNALSGLEDFGLERLNYVNHGMRLIGTFDGKTEFSAVTPDLTRFSKAARHYSCVCVGVWHILEITAVEIGDAFHLRAFELTASYAGRLS